MRYCTDTTKSMTLTTSISSVQTFIIAEVPLIVEQLAPSKLPRLSRLQVRFPN